MGVDDAFDDLLVGHPDSFGNGWLLKGRERGPNLGRVVPRRSPGDLDGVGSLQLDVVLEGRETDVDDAELGGEQSAGQDGGLLPLSGQLEGQGGELDHVVDDPHSEVGELCDLGALVLHVTVGAEHVGDDFEGSSGVGGDLAGL